MTSADFPPAVKAPRSWRLIWPFLALAGIVIFNLVATPGFTQVRVEQGRLYGIPIFILKNGAPTVLVAIGMTLVIATGGVDLSVGAVIAIAGALAAYLVTEVKMPAPVAITAALGTALMAGIFNGVLVAVLELQPIVATLVLMVAGRGIAQLITGGQHIDFSNKALEFFGLGTVAAVPFPIVLAAIVFAVVWLLTRKTAAGLFIEAVGNNATAARFAGVNERGVKVLVYAVSGLCSGLAGLIIAADIRSADPNHAGLYLELDAILAVVIGGTALAGGRFLLVGSVLGALIIQSVTTTIFTRNVPVELTQIVKGIVVIAVCLLYSPRFRAIVARPVTRWKKGARRAGCIASPQEQPAVAGVENVTAGSARRTP